MTRGALHMKNLILAAGTLLGACCAGAAAPKYVFLFIGDGMSMPQRMTAEEYARATDYGPLAMNALQYQCTTRTRSANKLVTDSAAAATAIACGAKADNGALGLAPDGTPLESVASVARRKGMKVGVMTTVTIVHATPAGFYAHRKSRGDTYGIGLDLVDSGFDFFAGGGLYGAEDNRKHASYRGNVFDLAARAGYALVTNRTDFLARKPGCGRTWGVFAKEAFDFALDGNAGQPTLAEMVAKGIELLEGPQGFFLMAEGGKIDYAAHANDAATTVREILATDAAVKVALAFAAKHPAETLIVTTGDHETGGMTMGFAGLGYAIHLELLARQKCSAEAFSKRIGKMIEKNPSIAFADVKALVREQFGFCYAADEARSEADRLMVLSPKELAQLEKDFAEDVRFVRRRAQETTRHDVKRRRVFAATCQRLVAQHAGVSWTTGSHTALPTLTTAQGCGAERFTGYLENVDIARRLKALLD